MDDPERQLIERASQGDPIAVDELLERYLPRLRAFVRLKAGPAVRARESSSDIVQSVCRELLEGMEDFQYQGESAFRSWLFTAALRKIVDRDRFHRRERRDVGREVRVDAGTSGGNDPGAILAGYGSLFTPSREAAAREELERLEGIFDRLPEDYREAIVFSRILGLSHAEIAEKMGRSEGATRVLLHRALAKLTLLLGESDG